MTFLCLDLATTTGWAVWDGKLITSGVQSFALTRFEGGGMRFLKFQRWLDDVHALVHIDRLVFEEVRQRAASVAAGHMYGGFMGCLTAWCEANSIPYEGVPVQTIKKHATGKGNASKDEMVAAMRAKGHKPKDDNEADALSILYWMFDHVSPSAPSNRPAPDRESPRRVPLEHLSVDRRPVSR